MNKQIEETARTVAEEIVRQIENCPHMKIEVAAHEVRSALRRYEDLLQSVVEKARRNGPGGLRDLSLVDFGQRQSRMANIYTQCSWGEGCDVCHGGTDVESIMVLGIGNYRGRLLLEMCRKCAERLVAVTEARLEDGRRKRG